MAGMTTVIEAEGLTKRFGATQALAGVDLHADGGRVLALLGPNGAGKTTIVRILATLLKPDAGRARVCGYDVVADATVVRQVLALTGQYASVDDELTGTENLIMICRLLGFGRAASRTRAREMLERFELAEAAGRAVKGYSGGMRRRLDLAASLLGEPEVLFLDEPTTGLDPRGRGQMWDTVRGVVAAGATVLLTTQYLEEADELADQIAVIDHGLVVASGTPAELKARTGSQTLAVRATDPGHTPQVAAVVAGAGGAAGRRRHRPGHRGGQRPGDGPGRGPAARRCRDRGRRAEPAAAQPGRGVPDPDRAPGRRRRARTGRDGGMTTLSDSIEGRLPKGAASGPVGGPPREFRRRIGVAQTLANGLTLAWRNVTQLKHSPEKLMDVTLMPIVFLVLFLYVFGGVVAAAPTRTWRCCCPA